ncbi:MAG: M28 family peptidase [Flavobacteriales bacterium]|nr:M28 family peptidase [Flavobacteriales bacterium]
MRILPSITVYLLLGCSALPAQPVASVKGKARGYVDTLAGPAMHGRGYVQEGDRLAADWIARQFDRLGLETLHEHRFQPFSFAVNTFPDSVRVSVDGRALVPGVDFITDPASGLSEGEFRLVRLVPEDLLSPERRALTMGVVSGNAAYLDFPSTSDRDTLMVYRQLEEEVVRYAPVLRKAHGKLTWSVSSTQRRNAIVEVRAGLIPDTAQTVTLRVRNTFIPRHQARNVFGVVEAKGGSKDWLVVTAHYDHLGHMGPDVLFPGANDNASGVSMLLCLAEEIKKKPLKKNVLFIAFAGEEAGLQGSTWCVTDRPIELERIHMLINLDLAGTGEEGITVVNSTEQQKLFDQLVAINTKEQLLPAVKPRGPACNSDHCPFMQKGVPAVFIYTMGGISAYHDVYDRPETLPLTEFDDLHRLLLGALRSL